LIDVVIIDPSSTEFNRGSFCYLPYLLYSALKEEKLKVEFFEDFNVSQIDFLPEAQNYLVSLWSCPQIDSCVVLNRFLPFGKKYFFGYYPLIEYFKFPCLVVPDNLILEGMKSYYKMYSSFRTILLSDCDMHLKEYNGQVYPLFTSYGCNRSCSFCPTSINCSRKILSLDREEIKKILNFCNDVGVRNIHFTDEDFFYNIDRTYDILKSVEFKEMNFIALGNADKVLRFIGKYGQEIFLNSGLRLIEVGFETGSSELAKSMNKPNFSKCKELAEKIDKSLVKLFWLTMTFFPGETLQTIKETSDFLRKYGYEIEELYGRIATNSTIGGLGQFFQPYHGTKDYEILRDKGIFISDRPIRLVPSFLPNTFLDDFVEQKRKITTDDIKWFDLYNFRTDIELLNNTVRENIDNIVKNRKDINIGQAATYLAICSRLGII